MDLMIKLINSIKYRFIHNKYKQYTMIPKSIFVSNLQLCSQFRHLSGCVVECGVWRGGMSAAMAEVLGGSRHYFLFDSFEGLPPAQEVDGAAALKWQADKNSPYYFDNCSAEEGFAERAMKLSGVIQYRLVKGWFSETLPGYRFDHKIMVLRLDADWYDSTMICLNTLFPQVTHGGLIIIDDYYTWDGCSRAVHDFLSLNKRSEKIRQSGRGVCYLIKEMDE